MHLICRFIPDGENVWAALEATMLKYKDKVDAKGVPLLTDKTWKAHNNQKRLVVNMNGLSGGLRCLLY
jgi:hypothetical protein